MKNPTYPGVYYITWRDLLGKSCQGYVVVSSTNHGLVAKMAAYLDDDFNPIPGSIIGSYTSVSEWKNFTWNMMSCSPTG